MEETKIIETIKTEEAKIMEPHIEAVEEAEEAIIDPWKVAGKINYLKLINKFGTSPIQGSLIKRWEEVTHVKAHRWLRRGIFFSHQDLEKLLDEKEAGKQIYLYTGRGPSSESMHLGHMIPFMFSQYLQYALDAIIIIQMSDDEKFFFKGGSLDEYKRLSYENAKDIIACGFDADKTFIFSNLETMGGDLYYNNAIIMAAMTGNQIKGAYGLDLNNTIGQLVWPCFQSAPAFSTSFKDIFGDKPIYCLVPMAIDQAPYFRMARDIAKKLKCPKPAVIHSRFLPGLEGPSGKMSSTDSSSATLFLNLSRKQIIKIINKHAFSGGRETLEDHRQYGGDIRVDVCYQYLCYFLDSDKELENIAQKYTSGEMTTGELKKITGELIADVITQHKTARDAITPQTLAHFFNRHREFNTCLSERKEDIASNYTDYDKYGIDFDLTFGYQSKPMP